MDLRVSGFNWDKGNRVKCQNMVFRLRTSKPFSLTVPELTPIRNTRRTRIVAVGGTSTGRPVFVAFTIRAANNRRFIRPVTARFMHAKEVAAYEEESSTTENG